MQGRNADMRTAHCPRMTRRPDSLGGFATCLAAVNMVYAHHPLPSPPPPTTDPTQSFFRQSPGILFLSLCVLPVPRGLRSSNAPPSRSLGGSVLLERCRCRLYHTALRESSGTRRPLEDSSRQQANRWLLSTRTATCCCTLPTVTCSAIDVSDLPFLVFPSNIPM